MFASANALQPETCRKTPVVNQGVLITCCSEEEHIPWAATGCLCRKVFRKNLLQDLDFGWGLEEEAKAAGICSGLDGFRKTGQLMILINLICRERRPAGEESCNGKEVRLITNFGQEKGCLVFYGWQSDLVFVCTQVNVWSAHHVSE